jgi:hypothetical protein
VIRAEKSGAGKSYELVLAETFDITDPFVDQTTNDCICKVSKARDDLFNGADRSPDRFIQATQELVARATQLKSEQLARIASLEFRQAVKRGFMTVDQVG